MSPESLAVEGSFDFAPTVELTTWSPMLVCPRCHSSLEAPERYCLACGSEEPLRGWPDDALIGRSIAGRYRVERRIGAGGMGTVYRAVDRNGAPVAVKTLHGQYAQSDEMVRRFRREARSAALLQGPHAVHVFEVGELPDGTLFYVMDLVRGESLARRLRRLGALDVVEALPLLAQLADGLAEAHSIGLVHRDLKPDNLFIVEDGDGLPCLKILDFGIVKVLDARVGTVGETHPGRIFGTPEFMSPEQARGDAEVDHRSDIFSAGVVAFLILTGRLPFDGATPQAAMMRRMGHDAPSLADVCTDRVFPPLLEAIVARMLARDPLARYRTMAEVRAELAAVDPDDVLAAGATFEQRRVDLPSTPRIRAAATPSLADTTPAVPAASAESAPAGRRASRSGVTRTRFGRAVRLLLAAALFLGAMAAFAWLLTRA